MIPASFTTLDKLPLSSNGKVDRRALPAPDQARPEVGAEFVAPQSPAEEALAAIWAEVLGVARIGTHDNFFDLGGDSILATQALSRINKRFNVELNLFNFFEQPTVAGLAGSITHAQTQTIDPEDLARILDEVSSGAAAGAAGA
jgi:acyl carrier protein